MDTLEELNKTWINKLDGVGVLLLPFGIVLSLILAYLDILELAVGAGITIFGSLVISMLHHYAVYHFVSCPKCKNNLAKFKNGKNIPIKQLYNGFEKCAPCKHCGWSARNGV